MNLDEIEARANAATPGPWEGKRNGGMYARDREPVFETGCGCCSDPDLTDENSAFIAHARTDVPALIARVRELEEAWSAAEAHGLHTEGIRDLADALGIREGKMTADGVARHALQRVRELEAERDAYARSHLILKAIHGALTDALPSTPIPALDSFDVVEMVRNIVAECERMRTFAAQSLSQMIRQEAEQMREYGLSYEGVRKVLREHDDGEISFGKLMDLIRAAARAMAEDMQK